MPISTMTDRTLAGAGIAIVLQRGEGLAHSELIAADAASGGALRRAMSVAGFKGGKGALLSLVAPAGLDLDRLILVGTEGVETALDYRRLGARLAVLPELRGRTARLFVDDEAPLDAAARALAVARGFALRDYRFDRYKPALSADATSLVLAGLDASIEGALAALRIEVEATHFVRDLVNEPGNALPPAEMARRIAEAATAAGVDVTILDEAELTARGFNLVLGVGQGSANPPRVVVLRTGGAGEPVALVGKGITFDMGGINVKPVPGMWEMKGDMAGAAMMAGTVIALARAGANAPVVAVLGLAENMSSGSSIRPGDILRSLSGQTVEVRNTDCEGRLLLADCLTFAQREYGAKTVIDAATLTYAVQIGLGTRYAGLYGNCDGLIGELQDGAEAAGELVWPMPIDAGFHAELASDFADMLNWPGVTYGNASIAAAFLEKFVEPGVAWAHIDIAGPAYAAKGTDFSPPGGTGYGVELLLNFFEGRAAKTRR